MITYFLALLAYCLVLKYNPVVRLFEHFYGTCYNIRYEDIYGYPHTVKVWCKDPREAGLIALLFAQVEEDAPDLIASMRITPNGTKSTEPSM